MSMASLEREIWAELKKVTGNNKLKIKDIMEWSTGKIEAQGEENLIHLPNLKVSVAYIGK